MENQHAPAKLAADIIVLKLAVAGLARALPRAPKNQLVSELKALAVTADLQMKATQVPEEVSFLLATSVGDLLLLIQE
ncbi:hypothetical protein [Cupriavidus sp. amp6]|uniref:hypothetical protein n=1 Tax=Cupriavidus sp. amp6 TaxID=388051 RepID=UPI0004038415|nr:hypothetical protein [Cupriavidus sp. amp6]